MVIYCILLACYRVAADEEGPDVRESPGRDAGAEPAGAERFTGGFLIGLRRNDHNLRSCALAQLGIVRLITHRAWAAGLDVRFGYFH
jgi:hypothetical protein